jgi:signal transduction histidine kinase/ligand-binding sensor domain-containing protein/DNA-binding response OmpR family regulator
MSVLRFALFVLFFCGLCFCFETKGQNKQYQFERIDMSLGLSHQTVNDIFKDSIGFLWFATSSGLNRYDGYSIKIFKSIPGDSTSLVTDDVTKLFEGPGGNMWIYTHSGNCVYNPRKEIFYRNTDAILASMSISPGLITQIKKDNAHNFWFVHYNQGLFRFNELTGKTTRLTHNDQDSTTIFSQALSSVDIDKNGDIWIIHQSGTFERLDPKSLRITYRNTSVSKKFRSQLFDYNLMIDADNDLWMHSDRNYGCFYFNQEKSELKSLNLENGTLNSNIVKKIVQDDFGVVWIGTENGGANLYNKQTGAVKYLLNEEEDDKSINENSIHAMLKDKEGIIWLGTYKSGVAYYHPNIFRFQLFRQQRSKPGSLPFNDINAFAEDQKGNLWIGTNGGGLIYFNRKTNVFKQYLNNPNDRNSISNNVIVSLLMDHEGILWIGTYYGGLNKFDGNKFTIFKNDPQNPKSLGDDNIWDILEDSDHNLWIGTLKGGADFYNRSKNEFYHYRSGDINSIHTSYVPSIMEDRNGNIWIGTGYGLEVLDKQSGRFVHYLSDPNKQETLSNNGVLAVFQDSRGLIWIGTHGGLNLFEPTTQTFRSFQEKDGLNHNFIFTIIEDDEHNLWISTPKGLSRLSITQGNGGSYEFAFKNYSESDGLISGAFHENASIKCASGELVFGGSNGFNIFQPEYIAVDTTRPRVVLTDFKVFNRDVKIGEEVNNNLILPQAISRMSNVTLKPDNNVFSIEFSAVNFFHPEKSQYRYILEGFSNQWLTTDEGQRSVTFTNLDPGNYIFKIVATNSDGVWSDSPTVLYIEVLPPFWKSNLAFFVYAVLIIAGLFFIRWLTITKERMNFRIQQERHEAHRMHELDMMKIKFFTNISHEFRTPLTLILTPLEKFLKGSGSPEDQKQYRLMHRNARRLLNLVNQLLDFRKLEVQEVRLNLSEGDIVNFVRELVYSFSDLSEKKNILLTFTSQINSIETLFDQDKIEKIIFNLLSNAFKFTPENGKVSVELSVFGSGDEKQIELKVIDSGIGIPKEQQPRIFERFFQHDLPKSIVNQGSGIGLSITHEFVKAHGGTIEVMSEPGHGSIFTVRLPLTEIPHETEGATPSESDLDAETIGGEIDVNGKPLLLLVEDNEDFRFYLKDNLKLHYSIAEAADGKEGFKKAMALIPDLIVSDVMMPEVNGIEMCRKIRTDPKTSHIPLILLTARNSEDQKIEGFETGANDYITKPFSFEILQSRIKNLISQREVVQKQFQKHLDIKASDIHVTSHDEKMIQKAIETVETNIINKDFSVEEMSRLMGMSRVLLYKKLLALTGKTPIEFIRTIRLQRAAQLLEKSQFTVSEIAYQVGFNNPKYFAKYFKEQYSMLPSTYAAAKRENR